MFPKTTVPLDRDKAKKVLRLVEALEDLDDVHDVYANFDIPDEVLEEVASL
jgi:transcriptional/translational regulatory protein YebC/TACO1